eukprot:784734-Pyramimonas_sp.AAC.1
MEGGSFSKRGFRFSNVRIRLNSVCNFKVRGGSVSKCGSRLSAEHIGSKTVQPPGLCQNVILALAPRAF